jgi:hypothetical protein
MRLEVHGQPIIALSRAPREQEGHQRTRLVAKKAEQQEHKR